MSSIKVTNLASDAQSKIKTAIDSLNTIFKDQNFSVGDELLSKLLIDQIGGSDMFNEIYRESFNKTLDKYKDMGIKLDGMRSTFLPIELIREVKTDVADLFDEAKGIANALSEPKQVEAIMDKKFFVESYENTFFRMLGMPTELEVSDFIKRSSKDGSFSFASESLDLIEDQAAQIMNERQTNGIRNINIDKNLFVPKPKEEPKPETAAGPTGETGLGQESAEPTGETGLEQGAEGDSGVVEPMIQAPGDKDKPEAKKVSMEDLLNIGNNLFKTNYLLFPPLQDSRINHCISEPDKFVARPFMGSAFPKYNSEKVKVSMLESIIRIRLDKLTGYGKDEVEKLSELGSANQYSFKDIKDSYGFIESLMINRMYSALYFLAEKLSENIQDYVKSADYAKLKISVEKNIQPGEKTSDNATGAEEKASGEATTEVGKNQDENYEVYRVIKSIDDTISLLLSSSETLNIQSNTFRTSSISEGQLMGILNAIVYTPGKFAESKLKKLKKVQEKILGSSNGIDDNVSKISLTLGVGRGVGLIDFICFTLGLFLLKEDDLIGLLNEEQFKLLKSSYPTFNFFGFNYRKKSITSSLSEYTKIVIGLYQLAEQIIASSDLDLS